MEYYNFYSVRIILLILKQHTRVSVHYESILFMVVNIVPSTSEVFKVFKKERFVFFLAVPMQLRQQKLKFDTWLEAKDLSKFNDIGYEAPLNTFNPKIWGSLPNLTKYISRSAGLEDLVLYQDW